VVGRVRGHHNTLSATTAFYIYLKIRSKYEKSRENKDRY
jgi:hypothetical protein